jgi:hypothetical protein
LKCNEIWAIRVRLQIRRRIRDLALFNLAIDSKLRACDLVPQASRPLTDTTLYLVLTNANDAFWESVPDR